jgi:hypothetical protein
MTESNPYLRRLDQIEAARKQWRESEWRLDFLRPIEPVPCPPPTDEQLLVWQQKHAGSN